MMLCRTLLSVSRWSDSGFTLGRFGSISGAAYKFSGSIVLSKIIAAILMLLFRRRDTATASKVTQHSTRSGVGRRQTNYPVGASSAPPEWWSALASARLASAS